MGLVQDTVYGALSYLPYFWDLEEQIDVDTLKPFFLVAHKKWEHNIFS